MQLYPATNSNALTTSIPQRDICTLFRSLALLLFAPLLFQPTRKSVDSDILA
jgi:hypothetical protein